MKPINTLNLELLHMIVIHKSMCSPEGTNDTLLGEMREAFYSTRHSEGFTSLMRMKVITTCDYLASIFTRTPAKKKMAGIFITGIIIYMGQIEGALTLPYTYPALPWKELGSIYCANYILISKISLFAYLAKSSIGTL